MPDLAAAYVPFARSLARPFRAKFPRLADDIDGEALLALVRRGADYDPARGVAFAAFAGPRIVGACRDLIRRERPLGYRESADPPPHVGPLPRWLADPGPSPGDAAEARDDHRRLAAAFDRLAAAPDRETDP